MSATVKEAKSLGDEVDVILDRAEKTPDLSKVAAENPTRFKLDGVEYSVSFRMGHQKAFQRAMGESVVSALVAMESSPGDMLRMSALFRFALTPQVDEDTADGIIDRIGIGKTLKLITAASQEAFSELGDPQKDQPAK